MVGGGAHNWLCTIEVKRKTIGNKKKTGNTRQLPLEEPYFV